jgi:hypothetical protein
MDQATASMFAEEGVKITYQGRYLFVVLVFQCEHSFSKFERSQAKDGKFIIRNTNQDGKIILGNAMAEVG